MFTISQLFQQNWKRIVSWETLKVILLGQCLSILITGTGISSQLLADKYSISIPTTQSVLNYVLLSCYWFYIAYTRYYKNPNATITNINETTTEAPNVRQEPIDIPNESFYVPAWVKKGIDNKLIYVVLSIADVEANYLVVKAYQYTTITSVMLLDCFSIPCVMILSRFLMKTKYSFKQLGGVLVCITGLGVLVISDYFWNPQPQAGGNPVAGDFLCLAAATLYAVSNVGQEIVIKHTHNRTQWLATIGVCGTVISFVQLLILERTELAGIHWDRSSSAPIFFLMVWFATCLFLMYSLVPSILMMGSATVFNLSLLTSDVFAIISGIFLFNNEPSFLYFLALLVIVGGLVLYHSEAPAPEKGYSELPAEGSPQSTLY